MFDLQLRIFADCSPGNPLVLSVFPAAEVFKQRDPQNPWRRTQALEAPQKTAVAVPAALFPGMTLRKIFY